MGPRKHVLDVVQIPRAKGWVIMRQIGSVLHVQLGSRSLAMANGLAYLSVCLPGHVTGLLC